jgi:hypothetical protein
MLGDEGASFGISLLVHLVLLAALAIPVLHHASSAGPIFSTTISDDGGFGDSELGGIIDTELGSPTDGGEAMPFELPDLAATDTGVAAAALLNAPIGIGNGTGVGVGEGGDGRGGSGGGLGIGSPVPANAVTAGSFTAFTTPTFNAVFPRRFGMPDPQPGDAPQPRQPYFITIQIKVPDGRKTYPLSDLSGTVVGTDNWTQSFPFDRAHPNAVFVMNRDGKLVRPSSSLRVVDGVVQIVVLVPGALALVKDVIHVESKMLDEAQTLELVFAEDPLEE